MTTPVFRASFSVLNEWSRGNWERAVEMYFKLGSYTSEAMADGKHYHEEWADHIARTRTLPEVFDGTLLQEPVCEKKMEIMLAPWLQLVGIPDCRDGEVIYEFKTGAKTSNQYARSHQPGVYAVLCIASGIPVKKVMICCRNFSNGKTTISTVWITDAMVAEAANWIETVASEMHNYLTTNNLYAQLGGGATINL